MYLLFTYIHKIWEEGISGHYWILHVAESFKNHLPEKVLFEHSWREEREAEEVFYPTKLSKEEGHWLNFLSCSQFTFQMKEFYKHSRAELNSSSSFHQERSSSGLVTTLTFTQHHPNKTRYNDLARNYTLSSKLELQPFPNKIDNELL